MERDNSAVAQRTGEIHTGLSRGLVSGPPDAGLVPEPVMSRLSTDPEECAVFDASDSDVLFLPADEIRLQAAFGQALCASRVRYDLSQRELSIASGLEISYISYLERGRRCPRLAVLFRFSETLGLSPAALIAETACEFERLRAMPLAELVPATRPTVFTPGIGARSSAEPLPRLSRQPEINLQELKTALGVVVEEYLLKAPLTNREVLSRGSFSADYWCRVRYGRCHPGLIALWRIAFAVRARPASLVEDTFIRYQLAVEGSSAQAAGRRRRFIASMGSTGRFASASAVQVRSKPLRSPLKEPLKAFQVLESTLKGSTIAHCAQEFGVSQSYCNQLATRAVETLLQLEFVREHRVPVHDWWLHRKRLLYREHWLQLIEQARLILAGANPEAALVEGIQGTGLSESVHPVSGHQSAPVPKPPNSEEFAVELATERNLRAAIQQFRASDRLPREKLYKRQAPSNTRGFRRGES
jgi:transcriptional regulator with XRE-family HTH domain